jgi:hypothetical protein
MVAVEDDAFVGGAGVLARATSFLQRQPILWKNFNSIPMIIDVASLSLLLLYVPAMLDLVVVLARFDFVGFLICSPSHLTTDKLNTGHRVFSTSRRIWSIPTVCIWCHSKACIWNPHTRRWSRGKRPWNVEGIPILAPTSVSLSLSLLFDVLEECSEDVGRGQSSTLSYKGVMCLLYRRGFLLLFVVVVVVVVVVIVVVVVAVVVVVVVES